MKVKIISFCGLIAFFSFANADTIESFRAKNIDISFGKKTSDSIKFDHLSVEREDDNFVLENATMDIVWQGDQLYLDNEDHAVQIPFINQTTKNNNNRYNARRMSVDYQMGKKFEISLDYANVMIKNNLYTLSKLSFLCKRIHNNNVTASILERCLTDSTMATLHTVVLSRPTANLLMQTLALPIKASPMSSSEKSLEDSSITIKNNFWTLESDFDGKTISMMGNIRYDASNHQLHIDISRATTKFIIPISVRSRIYKKLYSINSKFISVAPNKGTITLHLSHF